MVGAKRKPEETGKALGQRSIKAFFAPAPSLLRPQQQPAADSKVQAEEIPTCCAEGRSRRAAAAAADGQAATAGALQGLCAAVACTSSADGRTSGVVHSAAVRQEGESCRGAAGAAGEQHEPQQPPSTDGSQQQVCDVSNLTTQRCSASSPEQQAADASTGSREQQWQQPRQQEQELEQQSTSPAAGSAAAAGLPTSSSVSSPRGTGAGCSLPVEEGVRPGGVQDGGAGGLTALELQRLERIRRNQEVSRPARLKAGGTANSYPLCDLLSVIVSLPAAWTAMTS